jgi:hypothetical protein
MGNKFLLFLDFDDVLCLNPEGGYGGYDVLEALKEVQYRRKSMDDFPEIWATVFDEFARTFLEEIHNEFRPTFVLSTSWANFMNRAAMVTILRRAGLGFVADNLHEDWETEKGPRFLRRDEIRHWLIKHPECKHHWVVLDDTESGTGLQPRYMSKSEAPFVVLCDVNVGLTADKYAELRRAFLQRELRFRDQDFSAHVI